MGVARFSAERVVLSNDLLITLTTSVFAASSVMSSLRTGARVRAADLMGCAQRAPVVRLQDGLRGPIVVPDSLRFPAAVVATRITLVQLEAKVLVPPRKQEAHAERPLACHEMMRTLAATGALPTRSSAHLRIACSPA